MNSAARAASIIIDSLHALLGQRAGVLDLAACKAVDNSTRAEFLAEFRILGVIGQLGFFLGVQMIKVAVELIEAVGAGQEFILVAQVILAELSGRIALGFQQFGDGWILFTEAQIGAGHPYFTQAGTKHTLAGDKGGAAGGTALFGIIVGKNDAFVGDAVDVRRPVTHHPFRISADIGLANVVAPDNDDVGFGVRRLRGERRRAGG